MRPSTPGGGTSRTPTDDVLPRLAHTHATQRGAAAADEGPTTRPGTPTPECFERYQLHDGAVVTAVSGIELGVVGRAGLGYGMLEPTEPEGGPAAPDPDPGACRAHPALISLAVLVVATVGLVWLLQNELAKALLWFQTTPGVEGPMLFIALFTPVQYPVFLAGYMVLNLGAGYIYGPIAGAVVTSIGTAIGSTLSFLSLRYYFTGYMEMLTSTYSNYSKLVRVIEGRQGFKLMMMTRLTPLPMGIQNAIYASTSVSTTQFLQTTVLGLVPTQLLNSYMGSQLDDIADVVAGKVDNPAFLYAQVAMFAVVTMYVNSRMKHEVDRECEVETIDGDRVVDYNVAVGEREAGGSGYDGRAKPIGTNHANTRLQSQLDGAVSLDMTQ